ncbi:MAG TPA: biotin transporter BioY [Armatimonadota bacterium]|jgi:biotin transport system substrate-specific component
MRTRPLASVAAARTALPTLAGARLSAGPLALRLAGAGVFAGLLALSAQVRLPLPFTPVPVTLQTMVVLLAGATLGPAGGAGAVALYLAAGLLGLPLFTTGAMFGPTCGYLLAFLPAALLVGWARRRGGFRGMVAGMVAADALILLVGALGLHVWTGVGFAAAFAAGSLPFVAGDALKLTAAAATSGLTVPAWRRLGGR